MIDNTTHVSRTVSGCFASLHQIRSIRRFVSTSVFIFTLLVMLMIMPHLHYSNATLTGLLAYQHCRLLSASLNAATRLIYWTSRCHHTTPATASLSRECVDLKLSVLICVRGLAPDYLSDDMHCIALPTPTVKCLSSSALMTGQQGWCDHAFLIASSRLWNSLQHDVTFAPTLRENIYIKFSFPTN